MIKFDHFVLRVSDFESAARFYKKLFDFAGLTITPDPKDEKSIGFQSADGFTLWIEEIQDLEVGERLGWLDHYALHCESREKVNLAFEFCQGQGWSIISEPKAYPDYGNFYGFSFRGPDGIKLEFVTR